VNHSFGYATAINQRKENQDCLGIWRFDDVVLGVVCDGMGGHAGGAHASALAVRTIHDEFKDRGDLAVGDALVKSIEAANQAIYDQARKNFRLMGMGTTVVAFALEGHTLHLAHVGDSRAHLVRGQRAKLLTRDHTMVNLFVDADLLSPEEASTHPEAHVLARSLGVERSVEVEAKEPILLRDGDVVALTSDGVHGVLEARHLIKHDWDRPDDAAGKIIESVADRRGEDNATVVAINVNAGTSEQADSDVPDPSVTGEAVRREAQALPEIKSNSALSPVGAMNPVAAPRAAQESPQVIVQTMDKRLILGAFAFVGLAAAAAAFVATSSRPVAAEQQTEAIVAAAPEPEVEPLYDPSELLAMSSVALNDRSGGLNSPWSEWAVDRVPAIDFDAASPTVRAPIYAPRIPERRQLVTHRVRHYTRPSITGPEVANTNQLAREGACARSATVAKEAIAISLDNAVIYQDVWDCYQSAQRALREVSFFSAAELERFERDFAEGPDRNKPESGLMTRIRLWNADSKQGSFSEVMRDLVGDAAASDALGQDLALAAYAAVAYQRAAEPTPSQIDAWASHVRHVRTAMATPLGEMLTRERPDMAVLIRNLIAEATRGATAGRADAPVPPAVLAASKDKPAPSAKPKRARVIRKKEPEKPVSRGLRVYKASGQSRSD